MRTNQYALYVAVVTACINFAVGLVPVWWKKTLILPLLFMSLFCTNTYAEEEKLPDWNSDTLTGDWNGVRGNLYQKGVAIGMTHKSDWLTNVSGGLKRGSDWEGHTEARVTLDLEKMMGWDATTVYLHYHSDLGAKFNSYYVGSFVGVDNIEVAKNTGQFYHAWIQKNFFKDSLSLLAGLYPVDSEFYTSETSAVFLKPPYGMANDFAQTGKNGPPIFPLGTPAVRAKLTTPDKNFYVMGALTNGMPGNPDNHHGTQIKLDGSLKIVELGWTPQDDETEAGKEATKEEIEEAETFHKTAVGFWRYSTRFDDLTDVDALGNPVRHHSQGGYFLTEHTLYNEPSHPSQGLSAFFRFGFATAEIHQADWTSSLGLRYHGLLPGRDDDIAGVAVTVNHASDHFRNTGNFDSHETDIEFTYRVQIKPWLAIQPSIQGVINPGMDPAISDAWVIGTRLEIEL